jgi:hypothetical protein
MSHDGLKPLTEMTKWELVDELVRLVEGRPGETGHALDDLRAELRLWEAKRGPLVGPVRVYEQDGTPWRARRPRVEPRMKLRPPRREQW